MEYFSSHLFYLQSAGNKLARAQKTGRLSGTSGQTTFFLLLPDYPHVSGGKSLGPPTHPASRAGDFPPERIFNSRISFAAAIQTTVDLSETKEQIVGTRGTPAPADLPTPDQTRRGKLG